MAYAGLLAYDSGQGKISENATLFYDFTKSERIYFMRYRPPVRSTAYSPLRGRSSIGYNDLQSRTPS